MSTIGPIGKPVIPPIISPVGVIGLPWDPVIGPPGQAPALTSAERITEDGDERVTEDFDERITE